MTLKEAQKLYPDSIRIALTHGDYYMTTSMLEHIGTRNCGVTPDKQSKVLYTKVGRRVSVVISSREAFIKEVGNPVVCKCSACGLYYLAYRRLTNVHDELNAQCPTCASLGCDSDIVHFETKREFWMRDLIVRILVPNKDPERVSSEYDTSLKDFPKHYNMLLPDDKSCADCMHYYDCFNSSVQKVNDTNCRWYPSKYSPK